jgi:hypothetical protein
MGRTFEFGSRGIRYSILTFVEEKGGVDCY